MRGRGSDGGLGPPFTGGDALRLAWASARQALHYLRLAPAAWMRGAQARWTAYRRELGQELADLGYAIRLRADRARRRLAVRTARVRWPAIGWRGHYRRFVKGTWPRWRYRLSGWLGPALQSPARSSWRYSTRSLWHLMLAADAAVIGLALTGLLGVHQAALAGVPTVARVVVLRAAAAPPTVIPATPEASLAVVADLGPSPTLPPRRVLPLRASAAARPETTLPAAPTGMAVAFVSVNEHDLEAVVAIPGLAPTPVLPAATATAPPSATSVVAPSAPPLVLSAVVASPTESPSAVFLLPSDTPWPSATVTEKEPSSPTVPPPTDTLSPTETLAPTPTATFVSASYTTWTPGLASAPGWIGPGQCVLSELYGPVGSGTAVWPAGDRWLSGYDFSGWHPGIDISAAYGAPIYAMDSGVVVYAGWNNQGYGNLVIVDHANGIWTAYAHLSQLLVTCLQGVTQGQVIAAAGSTGNSTAAHLHFETFRAGAGQVSPWALLPAP